MSAAATQTTMGEAEQRQARQRSRARSLFYFLRHSWVNSTGVALMGGLILLAVAGPWVLPDPFAMAPPDRFLAPSWAHPAGTDNIGRDQLARIVLGLRLSLLVSVGAVLLGFVSGVLLGLVSGYYGGMIDDVIMRVLDIFFAFPALLLALTLISVLGASMVNLILTMGVLFAPSLARVTRGPVLSIKQTEFVEAARVVGVSTRGVILRHILPNVIGPVIVAATIQLSAAILIEAGLSFLGLGITPPNPSLGGLINQSRQFMRQAPWLAVFPGLAITLLVISLNLMGDVLRDVLDPHRNEAHGS